MKVLNTKTHNKKSGTTVTVSIIQTTNPIRPAKHTSLSDIRKMASVEKSGTSFLRKLVFK